MTNFKKKLIATATLSIFTFGLAVLPMISAAQAKKTQPLKVVGMAKFILKGTVVSTTANTITLHITSTSKNAKVFNNKDKVISIDSKTSLTKTGKSILIKQIKPKDTLKVFGIFNKKTGSIGIVRWIKVTSK